MRAPEPAETAAFEKSQNDVFFLGVVPLFFGKRENSSLLCWSLPIMFVSNCTNLGPRELYIHIYFKLNKMRGLIQGKAGMSSSNLGMS